MVKALELQNNGRIQLGIADVRVEHGRQLEDRVAHRQGVHVDEQDLAVRELHIFRVIVPVDHVMILRDRFDHREELLPGFLRQIVLHEFAPGNDRLPDIGQFSLRHLRPVDLLQQLHVLLHAPVHLLRLGRQDLRERPGVEQFEHRAVALPDPHHVVGNGGGDPQNEGRPRHLPLVLDLLQRVGIVVDLHDVVHVDPVNGAVSTASDLLASFDGHDPVGLVHLHHLREAGHVKDLIDLGTDIADPDLRMLSAQPQQYAQACAGDVLQLLRVDLHRTGRSFFGDPEDLLLRLRGISRVNAPGKPQKYGAVPHFATDFPHAYSSCRTAALKRWSECPKTR